MIGTNIGSSLTNENKAIIFDWLLHTSPIFILKTCVVKQKSRQVNSQWSCKLVVNGVRMSSASDVEILGESESPDVKVKTIVDSGNYITKF